MKPELSPWWHVLPIHHGKSVNWHLEYRAYFLYLEKCLSPKNHIFYIFLVTWNSSSHFLFLKSRCLIDCRLQYQCDIISSFGEKRHISKEEVFQWAILCWNLSLAILLNYIILAMWKTGFMKHSSKRCAMGIYNVVSNKVSVFVKTSLITHQMFNLIWK